MSALAKLTVQGILSEGVNSLQQIGDCEARKREDPSSGEDPIPGQRDPWFGV